MTTTRRNFIKGICLACGSFFFKVCSQAADNDLEPGSWKPAYLKLEEKGAFARRVEQAMDKMEKCDLCPHRCKVNRTRGEKGFCNAPAKAVVHSYSPHFGEELPLVGRGGSGTIFFSNCNLRCVFCQNWPIAHEGRGREIDDEQLAQMMLNLQKRGCHNINVVTPTHVMPNILRATRIAMKNGLRLPLCYNTGGYELTENIELLNGIVDIYLPDLKFMDNEISAKYVIQGVGDYPEKAQQSIIEMYAQVGNLITDSRGIVLKGLMVRHLVMPNRKAGTREFVDWVVRNLSPDTYVNIMSQYRVEHMAFEYDKISRAITSREYVEAMEWAIEAGLRNLDKRSLSQLEIHRRMIS